MSAQGICRTPKRSLLRVHCSGRAEEDHLHAAAESEGGDDVQQRRKEALLVRSLCVAHAVGIV